MSTKAEEERLRRAIASLNGHYGNKVPIVTGADEVEPEEIEWIWPGRLARGKISLLEGDPGLGKSTLTIEISAGADRAEVSGMGKCSHAKEGSIYGVPAALWQIQDSDAGEIRSASLTVWRPTTGDGPDQFSMAIGTATGQYLISTVKGGEVVGSGSVTMHPAGQGAHFEVVGTDADGRSLRATFQCARFTEHLAEGG